MARHLARGGPGLNATDHPRAGRRGRARRALPWLLAAVPTLFVAWFFAYPLVTVLVTGIVGSALPGSRSTASLLDLARSSQLRGVLWFTTWQAVVSTVLTMVVALPPTVLLSTRSFPGRRLLRAVLTVPFVLPTTVVGAAFAVALGPRGPLPFDLRRSAAAIVLAHVFFNVAVVVRVVGAAWEAQSPRLLEAARTLGATAARARREVTVGLLVPAAASAAAIVFLFSFTSLGVVLVLGDRGHATIEVEILRRTRELLDLRGAAVLAVVQLVAVGLALWASVRLQRRAGVGVDAAPAGSLVPLGRRARLLAAFVAVEVGVLVVTPIGLLVARSFATPGGPSLDYYRALGSANRGSTAFVAPGTAIATTLRTALLATVVALVVGGIAAWLVERRAGRAASVLDVVLTLPLGTSAATLGFGFVLALDAPVDLRASPLLVPAAQSLVAIPFVVRVLVPALRQVRERLREAAATLGASPARTLREVDLPLVGRSAAVAAAFAFAVSAGEFGATVFIARPATPTMPVVIERLLSRPGDLAAGQAAAMATILLAVVVVVVLSFDVAATRATDRGGRS